MCGLLEETAEHMFGVKFLICLRFVFGKLLRCTPIQVQQVSEEKNKVISHVCLVTLWCTQWLVGVGNECRGERHNA